jgi:hypothetical protein
MNDFGISNEVLEEAEIEEELEVYGALDETGVGDDKIKIDCKHELKSFVKAPRLILVQESKPYVDKEGELHLKHTFSDTLAWWKDNETKFPILAKLARMYLAIQATSAPPSERIFSVATRIIKYDRARLEPDMAGDILFDQTNGDWYATRSVEEVGEYLVDLTTNQYHERIQTLGLLLATIKCHSCLGILATQNSQNRRSVK